MTLDIVASGNIVAFVILFVALLTSLPVMCGKEHLCNVNVHKRVHISNYVIDMCLKLKVGSYILSNHILAKWLYR
jgi:hypothetical protein